MYVYISKYNTQRMMCIKSVMGRLLIYVSTHSVVQKQAIITKITQPDHERAVEIQNLLI